MFKLSPIVEKQLRLAGWEPGRHIDPPPYVESLTQSGLEVFPAAKTFFAEFGGLRVQRVNSNPKEPNSWFHFQLGQCNMRREKLITASYEETYERQLCRIGSTDSAMRLYIGIEGEIYTETWDGDLARIGNTAFEAIDLLCLYNSQNYPWIGDDYHVKEEFLPHPPDSR